MKARLSVVLMVVLLPLSVSAVSDEEILLASLGSPEAASAMQDDDSPSQEWVSAMQGRWGQTTDIRDMRGLREIQQEVLAEINAVYAEREKQLPKVRGKGKTNTNFNVPEKIQAIISKYAENYQISEALVMALINVESSFNPHAVSKKGAKGLMQLMPVHTASKGADPFDAETNVNIGMGYLSRLLDKYGDIRLALAAYNAGEKAVDKYGGIPPYKETQLYVAKIMELLGG
ncbi:lytic transglycosylase domain-containing protein [Salmonella enterica]|nr:lytic transglycosylase domain-containing protein [Salmonella enterica]EKP2081080.1 lytic transglycosylase domain-containing protein [Salmonella enterica]EKP2109493.1 lytic transglycosylase domain-containing protein [Salmonella enterica]